MKIYAYLDNVDGFASWDCSPSCEASVFETHVTTLKWSDMNITSGNKLILLRHEYLIVTPGC